jgi:hypothetical protein
LIKSPLTPLFQREGEMRIFRREGEEEGKGYE